MKTLIKPFSLLILALTLSFNAFALNLQDAKAQGKVGEMPNGYIGAVVNSAEVMALVTEVNSKRQQLYLEMAHKYNVDVSQVAARAAVKAINKTLPGHYIQNEKGEWFKK